MGYIALEGVRRARRGTFAPKGLDEAVAGHHLIEVEEQRAQYGARLGSAQLDRSVAVGDAQAAQDPKLHAERLSGDPEAAVVSPHLPSSAAEYLTAAGEGKDR